MMILTPPSALADGAICHIACAITAKADYLFSTDIRMLKYKTDEIKLINPIEFFTNELEEIESKGGNE